MQQLRAIVNASEETIKIGPLAIRFLLTGDDSGGSVSVFGTAPLGMHSACPGPTSMGVSSTVQVSTPSIP